MPVLSESTRTVPGVFVEFDEGALVQEHRDALSRSRFALGVLLGHRVLGPGLGDLGHPALEIGQFACGGMQIHFPGGIRGGGAWAGSGRVVGGKRGGHGTAA